MVKCTELHLTSSNMGRRGTLKALIRSLLFASYDFYHFVSPKVVKGNAFNGLRKQKQSSYFYCRNSYISLSSGKQQPPWEPAQNISTDIHILCVNFDFYIIFIAEMSLTKRWTILHNCWKSVSSEILELFELKRGWESFSQGFMSSFDPWPEPII